MNRIDRIAAVVFHPLTYFVLGVLAFVGAEVNSWKWPQRVAVFTFPSATLLLGAAVLWAARSRGERG
jgi:hypothetical protein